MYAVSPSNSSGPADRTVALTRHYAGALRALGLCVPGAEAAVATLDLGRVVVWQVHADGTFRAIDHPVVVDEPLYAAGEAYWAPPAGESDTWPAGRYVFEIRPAVAGPSRWLGIEFVRVRDAGAARLR